MCGSRLLAFAAIVHFGSAVTASAQSDTAAAVRAGARVRVDADSGIHSGLARVARVAIIGSEATRGRTGTVVALGPDTLVLRLDSTDVMINVPLAAIRRLYVSRGPRSQGRDATIGFVGGAVGGLVFAFVMDQALGPDATMPYGQTAVTFAAVGLVSGLVSGGRERWRPVPVPGRTRLGGAGGGGLSLGARVTFQ